ncbi:MAG: VWA domain-containing protein [Armatimonadetes bacterium]|nr:VWA domain-containing protein [Armatimonadota bacterium]
MKRIGLIGIFVLGLWGCLWAAGSGPSPSDETSGMLAVIDPQGKRAGTCPLKHTDVKASISGYLTDVTVTQRFTNPYPDKINAVYTFPLSQSGAVYDMMMKVGARTIRGEIHPRDKARQIYEAARKQGHVAALLDQERPNIFTQSVANIEPGQDVVITLRYMEVLPYEDGDFQFVFPTVVGPRYVPGQPVANSGTGWAPDTDQVPDASRVTPPVTPQGTRAGHDLSIAVDIQPGAPLKNLRSELHQVEVTQGSDRAHVELASRNTIPNQDFILRYSTADDHVRDALLTHHGGKDGGYFAFVLQPPRRVQARHVNPKELVFVVDTSGSMRGDPLDKIKETMRHALANLNPQDTFNLITFSGDTRVVFPKPVPATPENVKTARGVLMGAQARGGTEMMTAIRTALAPSDSQKHVRVVVFMTDGYVGNDMAILGEIQKHPRARVFSFGVGSSVNRFLLDNVARAGRGEAEYITQATESRQVASRFYERIRHPVLTDIRLDFGNLPVEELYPTRIPDLFSSRPVLVVGRYRQPGRGEVVIRGTAGGKEWERAVKVELPGQAENPVLRQIWARRKIDHLMAADFSGLQSQPKPEIQEQITRLGVDYRLVSQFTSFVAVEDKTVTQGGQARTVAVPVEMPEGVSYEGVFGERDEQKPAALRVRSPMPAQTELVAEGRGVVNRGAVAAAPTAELHPSLVQALMVRDSLSGADSFEFEGIRVEHGRTVVRISFRQLSDKELKELGELGVEVLRREESAVVARVPLDKLEELAKKPYIVHIEPAKA